MKFELIKDVKLPNHKKRNPVFPPKPKEPAREAAILAGELFYFTGKPCKRGHLSKRYTNGHECVECKDSDRINNKHHIKMNQIKRTFGLSETEYKNLIEKQKCLCVICNNKLNFDKNTHIDHCKITKKVRGILCHWCNVGIGHFKHNPDLLRKAALYCEAE